MCSHVVVWVFQAYTRQDYITSLCTFMHRGNDCRVSSMDGRKELFMILNSTSIYLWNLFGAENCHYSYIRNGGYLGKKSIVGYFDKLRNCPRPAGARTHDPSQFFKVSASTFLTQVTALPSSVSLFVSL